VLPSQPNVEKSQLHGAVAVSALDHRLHSTAKTLLVINPQCLSTTRVYQGPYHANTIHSNGCPLRSSIALRHHPRRTLLLPPTSTSAIPSLTRSKRAVLRYHRRRSLEDQKHSERWQACQTLRRPVGQTECASAPLATSQCFGIADSDAQ
jgi:hypothetical protein